MSSVSLWLSALALVSGEDKVTVKTEVIKPTPGQASQPMVNPGRRQLQFGDKVPAGLKAPPMAHGTYATLEFGARKVHFAVDLAPEAN